MKPVAFASIGECMIELSAGNGADWRLGYAGDTFNTAWYVRAILPKAKRVAYVTGLGDDPFSDKMRDFFARAGVETDRIRTIAGRRPGLYAITLEKAERSFTYWRGESAARCLADDAAWLKRALDGAGMLYFSGITLAILAPPARQRLHEGARRRAEGRRDHRLRSELSAGALAEQEGGARGDRGGVRDLRHRAADALRRRSALRQELLAHGGPAGPIRLASSW